MGSDAMAWDWAEAHTAWCLFEDAARENPPVPRRHAFTDRLSLCRSGALNPRRECLGPVTPIRSGAGRHSAAGGPAWFVIGAPALPASGVKDPINRGTFV